MMASGSSILSVRFNRKDGMVGYRLHKSRAKSGR